MILHKNIKAMVPSPDTSFLDIVPEVFEGDKLALHIEYQYI